MPVGIRTDALRKVYTSPPPIAGQVRGSAFALARPSRPKTKHRDDVVALDGLLLEIRPGEIFGLLGPNGAGKSTTVG